MRVKLSTLKKFINETLQGVYEDTDRIRRGVLDNAPGESHTGFEESLEIEDDLDEDKDRLRRAADGHTERVGPSGGKFEESKKLRIRMKK